MIKSAQQHLVKDKESIQPALRGNLFYIDRSVMLIKMFGDSWSAPQYFYYAKHLNQSSNSCC
jgi:hypothetical protein